VFCRIDDPQLLMCCIAYRLPTGEASAMRLSKEALSTRVVVRRARRGATPFIWEINKDSMPEPVYVSSDAFVSMEAAYKAGQARLAEFTISFRAMPEQTEHHF
jgi:hypothetical protein